ncbi:MAG: hypothetical protein K0S61_3060 [Anaerocolumna sp.]|jgi:uncharacterized protein YuzE|nr:hypothetical protein [Anaerocolumna sp.]
MSKIKFKYDHKNDILYITIGVPKPSYGDEIEEGIVIRKDFNTDEINGITILDFLYRLNNDQKSLENLPMIDGIKDFDFKSIIN